MKEKLSDRLIEKNVYSLEAGKYQLDKLFVDFLFNNGFNLPSGVGHFSIINPQLKLWYKYFILTTSGPKGEGGDTGPIVL